MRPLLLFLSVPGAFGFTGALKLNRPCNAQHRFALLTSTCFKNSLLDDERNKSILSTCYDKYLDISERRPYRTKALSTGVVAIAGAILSQWIQAAAKGMPLFVDWHLVRSFALTGLLFEGPYLHWWYDQVLFRLGRFLNAKTNVSSRAATVAQIALDQTIGVAIFFPAYFLVYELMQALLLLRAPAMSAVNHRMATELLGVLKTNYIVWPLSSYIIFRRVPEALRVIVSSIVALFWNAYLCWRIA